MRDLSAFFSLFRLSSTTSQRSASIHLGYRTTSRTSRLQGMMYLSTISRKLSKTSELIERRYPIAAPGSLSLSWMSMCTKCLFQNFQVRVMRSSPFVEGLKTKSPTSASLSSAWALLEEMFLNFSCAILLGMNLPWLRLLGSVLKFSFFRSS